MVASVLWPERACASANDPFSLTSCRCSSACATGTPRALATQTPSVTMCKRVFISKSPWTGAAGLRPDAMGILQGLAEIHPDSDFRSGDDAELVERAAQLADVAIDAKRAGALEL